MYLTGKNKSPETYPSPRFGTGSGASPAFAFDQNTDPYVITTGDPPLQIAAATITVAAGSRIKIEGITTFQGQVASGRAILESPEIGSSFESSQSFGTGSDTQFRTCNYLALSDVQAGGAVTITLALAVIGDPGSQAASAGGNVLTLTEIPA